MPPNYQSLLSTPSMPCLPLENFNQVAAGIAYRICFLMLAARCPTSRSKIPATDLACRWITPALPHPTDAGARRR